MHKRQSKRRSILFWIFLLFTIPFAIGLISYASGFRFDKNTGEVIENAGISISTEPGGATVYIDGQALPDMTPVVHSLLPGMYTVSIHQDHHHEWKKEIVVRAGKSELFSDVLLFAQTTPILVEKIPEKAQFTSFTPTGTTQRLQLLEGPKTIVVNDQQDISFIVESIDDLKPLLRVEEEIKSATWNENNELLYATDNDIWLYTSTGENSLIRRQGLRFIDVAWHPNNKYIFYSDLTGIYVVELDTRDNRQRWKLADVHDADDLIVNKSGNTLFYRSGELYYSLQLY